MFLDFILAGSDISMHDGAVVAEATKMEINQTGRKIDQLLKLDHEKVELCSNEWKSDKTKYLKIRQQSKNIRSNCAILNSLHIMSKGVINKLMALDMIGSIGYIYLLELKGRVFIASSVEPIFLPQKFSDLERFKKTLDTIFAWRNFLDDLTEKVKDAQKVNSLDGVVRKRRFADNPNLDDVPDELPFIFFTPKNKRVHQNPDIRYST